MTPRPAKETRENFEAGRVDEWTAGGYRSSVRLRKEGGAIRMYWREPQTKRDRQHTLFTSDSRELRRRATAEAVAMSEALRAGGTEAQAEPKPTAETLTIFDACLLYMQGRAPGFTADMMEWGPAKLARWHAGLAPAVRDLIPSPRTLDKDVRTFRSIWLQPRFARGRLARDIEPADWRLTQQELLGTYSPRTVANWRDRLSLVFRYIRTEHRKSIGLLENPMDGARAPRAKARIPQYTKEERAKLLVAADAALAARRFWRVWVLLGVAHSGRRIEAMLHLTGSDHDFETDSVTWRAEWAKAENYERGNDVRPMTRLHRAAVAWAIEHHPNPRGPEHPVLWSPTNPTRPITYPQVLVAWHDLERRAGVEHIRGRAFHSMRRAIVTLLSHKLGVEKASDFVGMTPETANKFNYRQTLEASMSEAAAAVDDDLEGE